MFNNCLKVWKFLGRYLKFPIIDERKCVHSQPQLKNPLAFPCSNNDPADMSCHMALFKIRKNATPNIRHRTMFSLVLNGYLSPIILIYTFK